MCYARDAAPMSVRSDCGHLDPADASIESEDSSDLITPADLRGLNLETMV